jgi:hypothetical protein
MVPSAGTWLAGPFEGIPLIWLAYPMTVAGVGAAVSLVAVRGDTHLMRTWHEVEKAPPAYSPLH